MADLVAGGTLPEKLTAARRTGVRLFLIALLRGDDHLVDRSPRPKQKSAWTNPDRVFADGTQEAFVRLAILFHQPLRLREGNGADEMDKQSPHHEQENADEDVLEVLGREIFVENKRDLEQRCRPKREEKREVDA